jgi:hypothetical protein
MKHARIALAGLLLALSPAAAQVYLPPGVGLPPQSVIGNTLPQAGDAVAVSFAQLKATLNIPAIQSCSTSNWFNSLTAGGTFGCSQPSLSDISGFGANVVTFLGAPTSANLAAALTDETGTGLVVFSNSPTLVTPILGTPSSLTLTNATGLPLASVTGLGSGVATALGVNVGTAGSPVVNGGAGGTPSAIVLTNGTGTAAGLTAGTFTAGSAANLTSGTLLAARMPALTGDVTMGVGTTATTLAAGNAGNLNSGTLLPARTNGHMSGTATNDNAAAGEVGEYIESILASGSATSLTTTTAKTIVSLSLTAGDWEVSCAVSFLPAATTSVTQMATSVSLVTNTSDFTNGRVNTISTAAQVPGISTTALPTMPLRFSFASTTSVFCVGFATFTVSTMTAYGAIKARRVR